MTQIFNNITRSDRIDTGLIELLARDLTALTATSGDSDPENAPQDAICDNRTAGVLKLNGNVLIDYKNGFMNSTALSNTLQPLNSILTAMSSATLNVPCIITTAGDVFQVNNYGTAALNNTTITGTGALSKKNVVGTNYISDGSITQEKLETPISEESVFKCGDILYSARSGNRNGFLLLGSSRTLGSSTSSATYRSNDYYFLYHKLWVDPNSVIRNSLGAIMPKGITSSADFSSNNSIDLPLFGDQLGQFCVYYNVPGTYTYVVPNGVTKLHVECVGGAGGEGLGLDIATNPPSLVSGSKSKGGKVECDLTVTSGETLYINVGGAGGNGYEDSDGYSPPKTVIPGGYNGGGTGVKYSGFLVAMWDASGGGMSDVRIGGNALNNQVIVAGGGGGSIVGMTDGGDGGGLTGGSAVNTPECTTATGGTQVSGGNSSTHIKSGKPHVQNSGRGLGGSSPRFYDLSDYWGAGGGGGYYGGGAGIDAVVGAEACVSGGGGGSSYTDSTLCTNVIHTQGYSEATGDGWVKITLLTIPSNAYIKY